MSQDKRVMMNTRTAQAAPRPFLWRHWIALAALGALAIGLRMICIGQESAWFDEFSSRAAVKAPQGVLRYILTNEGNPPLYFFLLKAWSRVFGKSYYVLRAYSAFAGGACVPLFWICARRWRLGVGSAAVAVLALTFSPMQYAHSQQCRYYSTLSFMSIWWLAELAVVLEPDRPARPRWQFVLSGFLGFLTHYYFVFIAAATGLGALGWSLRDRRRGPVLGRVALNYAVLAAAALTLAPIAIYQIHHAPSPLHWAARPAWGDLAQVFTRAYWSGPGIAPEHSMTVLPLLLELVALGGLTTCWLRTRGAETETGWRPWAPGAFLAWACVGSVLLTFLVSIFGAPVFTIDRYTLVFLPPFLLALAHGWSLWPGRSVLGAGLLGCMIVSGPSLVEYWTKLQEFDWKTVVARVDSQWAPGDVLTFSPDWARYEYAANGGRREGGPALDALARRPDFKRAWVIVHELPRAEDNRLANDFVAQRPHVEIYRQKASRVSLVTSLPAPTPKNNP